MKSNFKELMMQAVFFIAACASVLAVVLICVFLFANGLPAMGKIGVFKFLLGTKWKPGNDIFGIFPMILGSIYVTAGAIVIGVPGRYPYFCIYGRVLSKENLQTSEDGNGASCRNSFYCIWILRTGGTGSGNPYFIPGKNQWKQYFNIFYSSWHDDSANHHRSNRKFSAYRIESLF